MGDRLRPNMSEKEMNQLCTELVGMFAYNAALNKPAKKPIQVERFLALSEDDRAMWMRVELEVATEALGAAPASVVERIAEGILKSDERAKADGQKYCPCQTCTWGRTVIEAFLIVSQRQRDQLAQEVEDTKLN